MAAKATLQLPCPGNPKQASLLTPKNLDHDPPTQLRIGVKGGSGADLLPGDIYPESPLLAMAAPPPPSNTTGSIIAHLASEGLAATTTTTTTATRSNIQTFIHLYMYMCNVISIGVIKQANVQGGGRNTQL